MLFKAQLEYPKSRLYKETEQCSIWNVQDPSWVVSAYSPMSRQYEKPQATGPSQTISCSSYDGT
jgi:hypothetical protein